MKMRKYGVAAVILAVVLGVTACGGASEEDAVGYVKAVLDATYKQEYADYAKFVDEDEAEVKKEMDEEFQSQMEQELAAVMGLDEGVKDSYSQVQRQVLALAKYQVTGAEKKDNGFVVTLEATPSDVYQTLEESSTEVVTEALAEDASTDLTEGSALADVVIKAVNRSIEKNTYGDPVTLEVNITEEDDTYTLKEEELLKIQEALFPGSTSN